MKVTILIHSLCALCASSSCSRKKKVLLCETRCRTCTTAFHAPCAYDASQSLHCWLRMVKVTTTACCRIALFTTSFCTVSLIFRRKLCGSVQIHTASISFTLLRPPILRKHVAISSFDSS